MFFILGYGIFRNFGIWDIGIYFGIQVNLILGYGIFWTVYFGIWDIAYPPNQASNMIKHTHFCGFRPGPEVIKLFLMLSSAETKIYPAHKC